MQTDTLTTYIYEIKDIQWDTDTSEYSVGPDGVPYGVADSYTFYWILDAGGYRDPDYYRDDCESAMQEYLLNVLTDMTGYCISSAYCDTIDSCFDLPLNAIEVSPPGLQVKPATITNEHKC